MISSDTVSLQLQSIYYNILICNRTGNSIFRPGFRLLTHAATKAFFIASNTFGIFNSDPSSVLAKFQTIHQIEILKTKTVKQWMKRNTTAWASFVAHAVAASEQPIDANIKSIDSIKETYHFIQTIEQALRPHGSDGAWDAIFSSFLLFNDNIQ